MKKILNLRTFLAILLAAAPIAATAQTTFFSDNFSNGSTINSATPVSPTTNSTSYENISSQTQTPPSSVTANDLRFGIGNGGGGNITEIQALFATNAIALTLPGDFIQLTVVYTNFWGLYSAGAASAVSFGLYNSGQVLPLAGGINGTEGIGNIASGGAQNWVGYMEQVATSSNPNYRLFTRPAQTQTTDNNQDLTSNGSSTKSFAGGANLGTSTAYVLPSTNQVYTDVFTIKLIGGSSYAITNQLYTNSAVASGTPATTLGSTVTNANFLTGGFDALAVGFYKKTDNSDSNVLDIASISVSGSVTVISAPPTITLEPIPATVPNGGSCAFIVNAQGFNTAYQWHRNGTNINNGGNISIVTSPDGSSSILAVSPAGSADVLSGANGYYVTVSGAGGFSTNSTMSSLSLTTATNLIWQGNGNVWDLNDQGTINNWFDINGSPQVFNFGDPVTFDDTGAGGTVTLTGPYLSAASVTVDSESGFIYTFAGTGSFAGAGSLIYTGPGQLTINNANTYSGGTVISNANAHLNLGNYAGLGTGPVTLAQAGGKMEIVNVGSATSGINGDIIADDDFTIQVDGVGTFAAVFFGNLSGVSGKTLTFNPKDLTTTNRFRVYGINTLDDANIVLNGPATSEAIFNGTVLAPYNPSGNQIYNGVISGNGGLVQRANGTTILNGQNTYSGGTFVTTGNMGFGVDSTPASGTVTSGPIGTGPLFVSPEVGSANGSGTVLAENGARTIANPIQYPSGTNNQTLVIGGTNALTFAGNYTLNGQDGLGSPVNRTFQVNNTNAVTAISGVIADGGLGFGLIKTGSGILVLNNTETYTGPTTVSGGALLVNGQLGAGSVTITNSTLGGSGTIPGAVTEQTNGIIAPGNLGIGTLTINNSLTLAGNLAIEVNKSVSPSNDAVVVSGVLSNTGTGTLTVTNLGPSLVVGDKFSVFNKAVSGGGTITVTGGGVNWTNNLAVDGSIQVIPNAVVLPVAAFSGTPTNIFVTQAVAFTDASTGSITNWIWNFGDGSSVTNASNTSVNHTYATAGNYTVSLTVNGAGGSNTSTQANYIVVKPKPSFGAPVLSNGSLILSGVNGPVGRQYRILSSTNVALALANWTPVWTNVVAADGSYGYTNSSLAGSGKFFILVSP